jgi:superfamily I DNA and/or RNA helicase
MTLVQNFEPDVVFLDEAGQATIPDACMAVGPYKERIQSIVVAGDPNQITPVVIAREANEALTVMGRSLLDRLVNDPGERCKHIMLNMQYRSHPHIMEWASREFYNNRLQSHPSTEHKQKDLAKTITAFFEQLGPHVKNRRRRMAVDVSSGAAFSEKYEDTMSFCNHVEAKYIAGLAERLLAFPPPKEGSRILPEHIGIVTPYKGQRSLIRKILRSKGLDEDMARIPDDGFLSTTNGIQGSEVEIVFISLCAKHKKGGIEKLAFVAREHALCVQNTRAKLFQVTFGKFAGWCQAIDNGHPQGETMHEFFRRSFTKFRSLVLSHYMSGDIVSYVDIDSVYFDKKPLPPSTSYFYTTTMPKVKNIENKWRME